jgi:phage shock protein PspC (stress-responsive transcriptional regulator)
MSTTDTASPPPTPPSAPAAPPPGRVLRRSRGGRVGAGVAAGLGEYFGLDPVLFRVLFATSAFFGGAGVIAYLIAWAAIPEEGTERAPIDGWVGQLRRRRIPPMLVAVVAGLLLWLVAFSWWAPGPFVPIVAGVVLLVVFFGRRELQSTPPPPDAAATTTATTTATSTPTGPVDLTKPAPPAGATTWVHEARNWVDESRAAHRARRRRALPIKLATLVALALTVIVLGIVDAASGVQLQVYFWSALGIIAAGLVIGLALRRTPVSLVALLVPAAIGAIAFAGSTASLHDGIGDRQWRPTASPAASYRLAFGQGTLDLTKLPPLTHPRTVHVTLGAGQVTIDAPKTMNVTVDANVHFGAITADRESVDDRERGGVNFNRTIDPPAGATGVPLTVVVHVADGRINVQHR